MISSEQGATENRQVLQRIRGLDGALRLVYVTPESVAQRSSLMSALQAAHRGRNLLRLVIDEVHCCSTMGHDFRPDYKKLFILKRTFPDVPLLAVTATATVRVEEDVAQVLLRDAGVAAHWRVFRGRFNRPNLAYEVLAKPAKAADAAARVGELLLGRFRGQSGIVYCFSRKDTEQMASALRGMGVSALPYHAKLDATAKLRAHEDWRDGRVAVVCATSAFGMGIDKPDVRFVLHATVPKCMESYLQESGRAGRDGLQAVCVLLYRALDALRVSQLVSGQRFGAEKLVEMIRYAEGSDACRRVSMARAFGESFDKQECQRGCDLCAQPQARVANYGLHAESMLRCMLRAGDEVTGHQLIDLWRGVGASTAATVFRAPKAWREEACERLLGNMLANKLLGLSWSYTAYATNTYLKPGEAAEALLKQDPPVLMLSAMPESMLRSGHAASSSKPSPALALARPAAAAAASSSSLVKRDGVASYFKPASALLRPSKPTPTAAPIELSDSEGDGGARGGLAAASSPVPPPRLSLASSQSSALKPPSATAASGTKRQPHDDDDDDDDDWIENAPPRKRVELAAVGTKTPWRLPTPPRVAPPAAPPLTVDVPAAAAGGEDDFDPDAYWSSSQHASSQPALSQQ